MAYYSWDSTWIVMGRNIVPHYSWFPFIWYDVVEERWHKILTTHIGGSPLKDIKVLKARVTKKQAWGFYKLLRD